MNAGALLSNNRPLIGERRLQSTSLGEKPHINPASGAVQSQVLVCGAEEVDQAVEAALIGQRAWKALGPQARRDALLRLADLVEAEAEPLRTMAALECGTPISVGGGAPLALSWIRYYAGWADKIEGTVSEPFGLPGIAYSLHEPIGTGDDSPLILVSRIDDRRGRPIGLPLLIVRRAEAPPRAAGGWSP